MPAGKSDGLNRAGREDLNRRASGLETRFQEPIEVHYCGALKSLASLSCGAQLVERGRGHEGAPVAFVTYLQRWSLNQL